VEIHAEEDLPREARSAAEFTAARQIVPPKSAEFAFHFRQTGRRRNFGAVLDFAAIT
jgi:hypothetical protein